MTTPKPTPAQLATYVEASNAIEGFVRSAFGRSSGHAVYTQHFTSAKRISDGEVLDPQGIHRLVMTGLMPAGERAGDLRRCETAFAGRACLPLEQVPTGMRLVKAALAGPSEPGTRVDWDRYAWHVHHLFQVVHPFADGNGRVGRLLLNQVRRQHGLPWLTIGIDDIDAYHRSIAAWVASPANPFRSST